MEEVDVFLEDPPIEYVRPTGLGTLGGNSYFAKPYLIRSPHRVHVGEDVWVNGRAFLSVVEEYRGVRYDPVLRIGDGCMFGSDLLIHCAGEVVLGNRVGISARVYIGDSFREYDDPTRSVVEAPISEPSPVRIRDGAFVGTGASILPGVTIGERAIVSVGSVVTRDVPPRAIVLGNPARVVRSWDYERRAWVIGESATTATRGS